MKVLIWFLCLFANAMVTTLAKENGIILGAIPTVVLYALAATLAQVLCGAWDKHKQKKTDKQNIAIAEINDEEIPQIRFCRKCGEALIDSSKYCRKCGTKIEKE